MASRKPVTPSVQVHNGLLPTPPMPEGLPPANLTENARKVLMKRYVRRGDDGQPAETVEEMFWRVAYHVAKVEEQWDADVEQRTVEYYHLLSSKKFFPNSPTFTGAGTPLGQLAACFVLPITDDMGRDSGRHLPDSPGCRPHPADRRREWVLVLEAATGRCIS